MRWMFRRCLTRPPTADELPRLLAFLERQQGRLAAGELKAEEIMGGREGEKLEEQAAWTAVARVLMNLDETITKG